MGKLPDSASIRSCSDEENDVFSSRLAVFSTITPTKKEVIWRHLFTNAARCLPTQQAITCSTLKSFKRGHRRLSRLQDRHGRQDRTPGPESGRHLAVAICLPPEWDLRISRGRKRKLFVGSRREPVVSGESLLGTLNGPGELVLAGRIDPWLWRPSARTNKETRERSRAIARGSGRTTQPRRATA